MALKDNELNKINYKLPQTWKIPFYELIGGKLNFKEFEKILYESPNLESIIGENTYIELISFNFNNTHIYNDITKFVLEKILFEENDYNCRLFTLIGKFYKNDIKSKTKNAKNLPEAIINIFEGAHISVHWRGSYYPAYDIKFLDKISYLKRPVRGCLNILPLSAVIIAYAADSDIALLMDNDGIVYIYLGITDEVCYGCEFFEALNKIFFGLGYGKLLCFKPARE